MPLRFATLARRRNRYATMLLTLALLALAAIVVMSISVGLIWWQQERIVFQPPRFAPEAPSDVRRVDFRAQDGQPLLGYLIEPPGSSGAPPPPLLIGFHGNADLAVWQIPWAQEVSRRTGWRVLLAEYRGYGGLGGIPTYETTRADARAALTFAVHALDATPTRVALFGHSLGSAVATELAAELSAGLGAELLSATRSPTPPASVPSEAHTADGGTLPATLLLQSPFTSAREMARVATTRAVHWAWRIISRVHYDTERRVASLAAPVWVAHGERDWLVPVWMGKRVFATAREKGRLLLVPDAGHNDVAVVGSEAYWSWLTEALTSAAGPMRLPRP